MATNPRPESQQSYYDPHDLKWSAAEKAIAHKAFDLALQHELNAVIQETQERAAKIVQPSDLWELESYLTQSRLHIDRKYDFRYSVLLFVFANLLREGQLTERDLRGLSEEKLSLIRRAAKI